MSVNSFNHEDEMTAAYDAAERALWHAIDSEIVSLPGKLVYPREGEDPHKVVAALARRITDAVIHSSAADIVDMNLGVQVEHAEMWI